MVPVYMTMQKWFFDSEGAFRGIKTGADACSEHESGISGLKYALGLGASNWGGINKCMPSIVPDCLDLVTTDNDVALVLAPVGAYIESRERRIDLVSCLRDNSLRADEQIVAWDEKSIVIIAPKSDASRAQAVKDLYEAFRSKDILIGAKLSDQYWGSGVSIFIRSRLPKEEIVLEDSRIKSVDEAKKALEKAALKEKFPKVSKALQKSGKRWFSLRPLRLRDNGKVLYWLNPMNQSKYKSGAFTIDELKEWANDNGPALKVSADNQPSFPGGF